MVKIHKAHLYILEKPKDSVDELALNNFERIAKEGRIHGFAHWFHVFAS